MENKGDFGEMNSLNFSRLISLTLDRLADLGRAGAQAHRTTITLILSLPPLSRADCISRCDMT
jgi:hypothetical protein